MSSIDEKLFSHGDTTLRRGLMTNLVVLVLVVTGVVGAVVLWGSYRAIGEVSEASIERAAAQTRANLDGFFGPVETNVEILEDWGKAGELKLEFGRVDEINDRLRPMLERMPQLSAVAMEDERGRQYVFWAEGDGWMGRFLEGDNAEDLQFVRWEQDGTELEQWTEQLDDEDLQRPWYQGAMATEAGQTHWTEPFEFFTDDEPGVVAARRFEDPDEDRQRVVALGVSLADISEFTTQMRPTENGYNAVLTADGRLVGLPAKARWEDPDLVRHEVLSDWEQLNLDSLGAALESWRDAEDDPRLVEADDEQGETVQAGFDRFELGDQNLVVATVVPRRDLTGIVDRQRNIAAGVGLVGLGLAVLLSMWISRRYQKRIARAYEDAHQFGQYRLTGKLGVGGMGEVYRAEHALLERSTAVKLLRPDMYDSDSVRRFEREVQLTCRLTHPNTVTIFDYGVTDDGLFYYAMELLEGVSLRDFLDYTGALPDGRVIYIVRQVCGALIEAHGIGLIHRDIKPSNIMIGDEGGMADRVTVLDFGLVKDVGAPDSGPVLTQQHQRKGSPGFMAPEVIRQGPSDDPAVDIYALGSVIYTLLCGQKPFEGESAVDTMMAQVEQKPTSPSELLERRVDPGLEEVIAKCMSKDPDRRPDSVREVLDQLLACDSADDWTLRDALQWWGEHREYLVEPHPPADTFEGTEAFEMTLTMGDDGTEATLDGAPDEVFEKSG